MANRAMGTTMGNPACEWVRARLPLWSGVDDDPTGETARGMISVPRTASPSGDI